MKKKSLSFRTKILLCFLFIDFLFAALIISNYSMVKKAIRLDQSSATEMSEFIQKYTRYGLGGFVVVAIVMILISVFIMKNLRVHLSKLRDSSTQIAEGMDIDEIPIAVRDEFGDVFEEFNQMIRSNKKQSEQMKAVSSGNLSIEIQPRSEGDIVGVALKQLVENNRTSIAMIRERAEQVDTAAGEVASAAEALAQGSTEQASAIEEINASIDDVSAKTKINAKESNEAVVLMNHALEDMQKGNSQMNDMVNAMNEINVSSENISKVIKVIDDIAFQTNILALNAAVEAARAGEAGRGFAVVAEEVRNLAAKSSAAAAETAEMIEDSIRKIHDGKSIADDTMKSIEAISTDISETAGIVKGIAEASNYQATVIEQINQAVNQVSEVVSNNSATSEECAAASMELSGQAKIIRESLSVYQLGTMEEEIDMSVTG